MGYEPQDLSTRANAYLESLKARTKVDHDGWGEELSERTQVFVWAWACARNGLDDLAHGLFDQAARMPGESGNMLRTKRPGEAVAKQGALQQAVADDIAHAEVWRAVLDFGDPQISRKQLLERFERFVKNFPTSAYVGTDEEPATQRESGTKQIWSQTAFVRETIRILRQMVREDVEHAAMRNDAKPFDELTRDEQISELIFQLRDQNGHQLSQPGSCNIFIGDLTGEKNTPAHQLVQIGYDAIPQLIMALDDRRFSRSVGYHRNFYFSHHVLRVGDCAEAIISRIAGRNFFQGTYTNAAMVKDGQVNATKKLVQEWWDEFQRKGEKQVLIETVARGDDNSVSQAKRLLAQYPEAALEAISQSVQSSKHSWTRTELVKLAAQLHDEAVSDFLLKELRNAPHLSTRVSAAHGLHARNRPEAVSAMIDEWRRRKFGFDDESESLIAFLAQCGSEAIRALADSLNRQSVSVRLQVICAFGERHGDFELASNGVDGNLEIPDALHKVSQESISIVESLLVSMLSDTAKRDGLFGTWNGKKFVDSRVCDVAGHVLSIRFREKYNFDLSASLPERDHQLVILQNIWREENDLELLPLPERRTNAGLPQTKVQPLFDLILSAETSSRRQEAIAQLELLGLAALPAVRQFSNSLLNDHPARADVGSLSSRLANTVVEILVERDSVTPNELLRGKLDGLMSRPLTAAKFIGILRETLSNLPEGATGISLTAHRFNDSTGVRLTVGLSSDFAYQAGTQKGWSLHERVRIGEKDIHNPSGSLGYEYAFTGEAYKRLSQAIQTALDAPPSEPCLIHASLKKEK